MAEKDYKIWERRFNSYQNAIQILYSRMKNDTPNMHHEESLRGLCKSLEKYSKILFDFFYEGFGLVENKPSYLEEFPPLPQEYIINTILNQIAHDLSILERAVDQRLEKEKVATLNQADVLAHESLNLAKDEGLLISKQITVVTYLYKLATSRVIPYAPIALIGIPYSSIDTDPDAREDSNYRDFLAIPHETGHYVYNHGEYQEQRIYEYLSKKLAKDPSLKKYAHWLEEIFADVYGCLVGGLATALSIQDILFDNLPSRFGHDDGSHPAHVIRPYIYSYVVAKAFKNAGWAEKLEAWWGEKLEKRGGPKLFILSPQTGDSETDVKQPILVEEGKANVNLIIDEILKLFPSIASDTSWIDVANRKPRETKFQDIYHHFVRRVKHNNSTLNRRRLNKFYSYDENNGKWTPRERTPTGEPLPDTKVLGDEIAAKIAKIDKEAMNSNKIWYWLFDSGGWTSGGDEDTYPNRTIESSLAINLVERNQLRKAALEL